MVSSLGQRGQADDEKPQKARQLLEKSSRNRQREHLNGPLPDAPIAKSGYIAVAGGEKNRYLPGKQYRILRKGKAVVRA